MQDELQPFSKKAHKKAKVPPSCVTDATAARAWAQSLLAGMDKPDVETRQAFRGKCFVLCLLLYASCGSFTWFRYWYEICFALHPIVIEQLTINLFQPPGPAGICTGEALQH